MIDGNMYLDFATSTPYYEMLADFLFAIPVDGGRFGGFPIFAALSRFLFQFLVELTSLVGGPVLGAVAAGCGAGAG